MTTSAQWQRTLDAVVELAEDIARIAPDCADRAMQIVRLIRTADPPTCETDTGDLDDVADLGVADLEIGPLRRSRPSDVA